MDKQKIKIIRKNDEYSAEYQIGDIFQVDSTWYGGANVTSVSGIPLSLDKDEYVLLEEAEKEVPIDHYSYEIAYHRIKPHVPPLVRAPVNSFEFHRCRRTPQVECLTLSLGHGQYIAHSEHSSFTVRTTRVSNPV